MNQSNLAVFFLGFTWQVATYILPHVLQHNFLKLYLNTNLSI